MTASSKFSSFAFLGTFLFFLNFWKIVLLDIKLLVYFFSSFAAFLILSYQILKYFYCSHLLILLRFPCMPESFFSCWLTLLLSKQALEEDGSPSLYFLPFMMGSLNSIDSVRQVWSGSVFLAWCAMVGASCGSMPQILSILTKIQ